jgi:hypothetical protein
MPRITGSSITPASPAARGCSLWLAATRNDAEFGVFDHAWADDLGQVAHNEGLQRKEVALPGNVFHFHNDAPRTIFAARSIADWIYHWEAGKSGLRFYGPRGDNKDPIR